MPAQHSVQGGQGKSLRRNCTDIKTIRHCDHIRWVQDQGIRKGVRGCRNEGGGKKSKIPIQDSIVVATGGDCKEVQEPENQTSVGRNILTIQLKVIAFSISNLQNLVVSGES